MEIKEPNDPREPSSAQCRNAVSQEQTCWGLLRRRSCIVPTFPGLVLMGLGLVGALILLVRCLYPFLAVNDPIPDGLLVVEGWTPDYGLEAAIQEFKRGHYQKIYVTGGPLELGTHLAAYQTYAQLAEATLIKLGMDSNFVQAVPAPLVRQDRTYTSAMALRKWLSEHGIRPARIHLISDGPHARRSRLLYEKSMGKGVIIGVTAIPSQAYDPQHWWRYSAGVRNVIDEGLAYLYARLIFSPPKE